MKIHTPQTFTPRWKGISLRIDFEPHWLDMTDYAVAHLDITATDPDRAPLPITETRHRSWFGSPEEIDARGGPVAYVLAWLDDAARDPRWKAAETARRQLYLF